MASSTVNIAEFRCPTVKHRTSPAEVPSGGLRVVTANPAPVEQLALGASANPPGIYDFAAARRRRHAGTQNLYDPSAFGRRRSNLVRFNEPRVAVLRVAARPQEIQTCATDDRDLPPAA